MHLRGVIEEIAVVSPRIVVVMGERALATLNDFDLPLSARIDPQPGEIQSLTPTIEATLSARDRLRARRPERQAGRSGTPSARSASGGRISLRTSAADGRR